MQQFKEGEAPYVVADSALDAEQNLEALSAVKWLTRVPEWGGPAKALESEIAAADMQASSLPGYRVLEVGVTYGQVRQRWVVVHAPAAEARELAALEKRVRREAERALRQMGHS